MSNPARGQEGRSSRVQTRGAGQTDGRSQFPLGTDVDPTSPWWDKPLEALDRGQWEQLCDGCGKCCLHKLECEDTGELFPTNVACKLLDRRTGLCSDYKRRKQFVGDCVHLTPGQVADLEWLPSTCAYRLRGEGKALPSWHHLITGCRNSVHEAGESVRGWTVSETEAGELEQHIVERTL